jgi:hypothetical protein
MQILQLQSFHCLVIRLIALTATLALASCAVLGTHKKVYPGPPPSQLVNLGFITIASPHSAKSPYSEAVDSLFAAKMTQHLNGPTSPLVQFIGSLHTSSVTQQVLDSIALANPTMAAIAFCELSVRSAGASLQASSNAWSRVYFIKTPERQLLARFKYNTLLGNSYWLDPPVTKAIEDASAGISRPIRKYLMNK